MQKSIGALLKGVRVALDQLVFLPYCLLGEHFLPDGGQLVCTDCLAQLKTTPEPHRPFGLSETESVLDDVVSYWEFSEDFRNLIHHLKYHQKPKVGVLLGRYVAGAIAEHWQISEGWLVPVPLHPVRRRERGYNQSEFIARGISQVSGLPVKTDVLIRSAYTKTQTHLSREERRSNLRDAFTVPRAYHSRLPQQTIILIDDVFTTGATLDSAARSLQGYRASAIFGLTLGTVPLRPSP